MKKGGIQGVQAFSLKRSLQNGYGLYPGAGMGPGGLSFVVSY